MTDLEREKTHAGRLPGWFRRGFNIRFFCACSATWHADRCICEEKPVVQHPHFGWYQKIALSANNRFLATANAGGEVESMGSRSGDLLATLLTSTGSSGKSVSIESGIPRHHDLNAAAPIWEWKPGRIVITSDVMIDRNVAFVPNRDEAIVIHDESTYHW